MAKHRALAKHKRSSAEHECADQEQREELEYSDDDITWKMKWINLFGSNKEEASGYGKAKKHAAEQNANVDKATTYNGRVLIEYGVFDSRHPEMKVRDIAA